MRAFKVPRFLALVVYLLAVFEVYRTGSGPSPFLAVICKRSVRPTGICGVLLRRLPFYSSKYLHVHISASDGLKRRNRVHYWSWLKCWQLLRLNSKERLCGFESVDQDRPCLFCHDADRPMTLYPAYTNPQYQSCNPLTQWHTPLPLLSTPLSCINRSLRTIQNRQSSHTWLSGSTESNFREKAHNHHLNPLVYCTFNLILCRL